MNQEYVNATSMEQGKGSTGTRLEAHMGQSHHCGSKKKQAAQDKPASDPHATTAHAPSHQQLVLLALVEVQLDSSQHAGDVSRSQDKIK